MGEFAAWAAILGDIGDFIGSIAVLITLIYLVLQVKHGQAMLALDNGFYQSGLGLIKGQMAATNKLARILQPQILQLR